MATIISNAQTDFGLSDGEDIVIAATGTLSSAFGAALSSVFNNHDIRVAGTLAGVTGIGLVGGDGASSAITLSATASVFGASAGIETGGDAIVITNAGSIMSDDTGIRIDSISSGSETQIINTGLISGSFGIIVTANTSAQFSDLTLVNHGTIMVLDSNALAYDNQHADGIDKIVNYGTIDGLISTGTSADSVTNKGTITGPISTGSGDDIVNNVYSDDEMNIIHLDSGEDRVFLGMAEEEIYGGQGYDIASYRDSSGVRVNLADILQNTREAARDFYSEIEQISGSQFYGDTLIGDDNDNVLFGDGGNDVLSGGNGKDMLIGGAHVDRLTGGLGNDTFRFTVGDPGRDVISDFSNSGGNNDRVQIAGLSLAGGPITGNLFRARADNVAQDGNDIFIFRTTDKSLWFDADGDGAGAAVMLADLQASATMTFQDIYILPL